MLKLTVVLFLLFGFSCYAEFMPSKEHLLNFSESANPDYPCFKLSYTGYKLYGMFGSVIPMIGSYSEDLYFTASLIPFLELHNYTNNEPVPWQLWRGSLGISTFWEFPKINDSQDLFKRLGGEFSIIHESDHATALKGYAEIYTNYENITDFNNANFSSYEYLSLKIQGLTGLLPESMDLTVSIGTKFYLRSSERKLLFGYNFEGIFREKITNEFYYFVSLYFENINNDFDSSAANYQIIRNKEPLTYFVLQFGAEILSAKNNALQIFAVTSNSNGRGLDFVDYYQDIGLGFKIIF